MKAPEHLSAATKKWWKAVEDEYSLDAHHYRLLQLACEAWDRCAQAREALEEHGLTYEDRFNAPHPRPEVAIERDSRLAFARLVRELNLDTEPEEPRPPRLGKGPRRA
jgi:P27 family predicted phage terminase small subunit